MAREQFNVDFAIHFGFLQLEKENKIFVIRPSRKVNIKRIEKDINKIQEMYDLGKNDVTEKLEELRMYLTK